VKGGRWRRSTRKRGTARSYLRKRGTFDEKHGHMNGADQTQGDNAAEIKREGLSEKQEGTNAE